MDRDPVEYPVSCFSCAKSTVFLGHLHCTKSGHAEPLHNTDPCIEWKELAAQ